MGNNGGNGVPTNTGEHGSGGGGAGGAGVNGDASNGGSGGIGVQMPSTFRDPLSTVGAPGPGGGKYWVAGGGGGQDFGPGVNTGGGPGGPYAGGGNSSADSNDPGSKEVQDLKTLVEVVVEVMLPVIPYMVDQVVLVLLSSHIYLINN